MAATAATTKKAKALTSGRRKGAEAAGRRAKSSAPLLAVD